VWTCIIVGSENVFWVLGSLPLKLFQIFHTRAKHLVGTRLMGGSICSWFESTEPGPFQANTFSICESYAALLKSCLNNWFYNVWHWQGTTCLVENWYPEVIVPASFPPGHYTLSWYFVTRLLVVMNPNFVMIL